MPPGNVGRLAESSGKRWLQYYSRQMRWIFLLAVVWLSVACGGKQPPAANTSYELDQRHCTSGNDCASGFCGADGRCG
jgi:hypothetical protein